MDAFPENVVDLINANMGGYNTALGLRIVKATPDEFVGEIDISEKHLQPYGLVHGGVYAGMIETLCSTGAALNIFAEKQECCRIGKYDLFSQSGSLRPFALRGPTACFRKAIARVGG